jgi:putative DNA primase/helicase
MNATFGASRPRPTPLTVIPEGIPFYQRERNHWVFWRYDLVDGNVTKPPYRADGKGKASSIDPATWSTFDVALRAYRTQGWDGIGSVLARFPAGHPYETSNDELIGVDLDHCRDRATGVLTPVAASIISMIDSYAEYSPSGDGIRIFAIATLPDEPRKRGNIEAYQSSRYLTCTGHHLPGTPSEIQARQAEVEVAYRLMILSHEQPRGRSSTGQPGATARFALQPVNLADRELIDRARVAGDGGKFARLWAGDWSGYTSQSDADEALCFKLVFWTGRDRARIDRLFRRSGLYRTKWDQRHYAADRTYGQGHVDKAIAEVAEVYRPGSGCIPRGQIVRRPDGVRVRRLPPAKRPQGVPAPHGKREVAR